ncbi:MAG: family 10 glycosylhydrolase [Phycisphaerales bacterium]|nr:family 10 glycosylhydrolase [Phycisphaerales bacterium]
MSQRIVRNAVTLAFLPALAVNLPAQTTIVDNSDAGYTDLTGTWLTTSASGQYGANYQYRLTNGPAGDVEWRPTLSVAGLYEVAAWYKNGNDRPSNARYTVHHAGGATDVFVDQRLNGSMWVSLGTFTLPTGDDAHVRLTSLAEPDRTIVADAVRFSLLSSPELVPELRACWLTHYWYLGKSEAQLRAAAQNIRAGGMNTVYLAMYSGGTTYWPSRAFKAAGGNWGSSTIDYAAYLVPIFQSEGLKVGAWFEYGLAQTGLTHPIAVARPEWLARDITGDAVTGENGGFVFFSPGHPEVVAFVAAMARELAEDYNFDDIQLDRYRWGRKNTGREYGYEQVTRDRYFQTYGVWPPSNVNNSQWVAFREGLVNACMQASYNAVKSVNPHILVSSAPLGSYGITQHMQRWSAWVNGGYMDLVMPQMYMTTLSSFITEFNTQRAQAPAHLDKLGVGYRASETNDWPIVASQLNYARGQGFPHGCLWVYHNYTSQVAIQDEIDNLPAPGQPWALPAYNPYVSDRMLQIVVDNRDGSPRYVESGPWTTSAQPDFFRFDSRVAPGGVPASAQFAAAIPKAGRFDVYAWYTASSNRHDAAEYIILHANGVTTVAIDQRTGGGQWVPLGRFVFDAAAVGPRVVLSNAGASAAQYTSADAVKLRLSGYAFGDADGDGETDAADLALSAGCWTGPGGGPVGSACEAFDLDDDADADLHDFARMQTRAG